MNASAGGVRPSRWLAVLAAIFVLALAPRLVAAATLDQPPTTANDAGWYDFFGRQIAAGHGYSLPDGSPTSRWPPGYPLFVGAVYKVTDDSRGALRLTQAVLGALTAVLAAELGRRLMNGAAGAAAGVLTALLPSHVMYSSLVLSEVLFTALIMAAFVLAMIRSPIAGAACGVALGLAVLVRSQAALLMWAIVAAWIAYGYFGREERAHTMRIGGALAVAFVLMLVPWTVRNAVRLDTFQPVSTNLGINLWMGNNPDATGKIMAPPVDEFEREIAGMENPEAEVRFDRLARDEALRRIAGNPGEFISRAPRKIWETYKNDRSVPAWYEPPGTPYLDPTVRQRIERVSDVAYFGLLLLAFAGAVALASKQARALALPVTAMAIWTLVSVVFFGDTRFHVPMLPVLALPAGYALARFAAFVAPGIPGLLGAPDEPEIAV